MYIFLIFALKIEDSRIVLLVLYNNECNNDRITLIRVNNEIKVDN